jgi:hypothetical protein
MQPDDLQQLWAAQGAVLERSLAIQEHLVRERLLGKARLGLAPWLVLRALEVLLSALALWALAPVVRAHVAEPRYLAVGGAVLVFAAGLGLQCARLLVHALHLDHAAPVTTLQREILRLQLAEYRSFVWALLGGTLLWLPGLLLVFEAVTGAPALARVGLGFLLGNLGFGLGVLVVGHLLSRRFVGRGEFGPRARRIVAALSGRGLRKASEQLDELARFVREEPR